MKRLDLVGQRFGRLLVLQKIESTQLPNGNRVGRWLCRCDCGNMVSVMTCNLINKPGKGTKSCGCLHKDGLRLRHGHNRRGQTTRTYKSWTSMIDRCTHPNHQAYKNYGGRGIVVCDRWLGKKEGFDNFLRDMGERPEGMSLDRYPDKNGNYEPGNCRWATRKEQADNRRSATQEPVIWDGNEFMTMTEFAKNHNITYKKLARKIYYWRKKNLTLDEIIQKHF